MVNVPTSLHISSSFSFPSLDFQLRTLTLESPSQIIWEQNRGGTKASMAHPLLPSDVWSSAQPVGTSCSPTGFGSPRGGRGRLAFPFKSVSYHPSLNQKPVPKSRERAFSSRYSIAPGPGSALFFLVMLCGGPFPAGRGR